MSCMHIYLEDVLWVRGAVAMMTSPRTDMMRKLTSAEREIADLFQRLAEGKDCRDWVADRYTYCGHVTLRKGPISVEIFIDCDEADYLAKIYIKGKPVYNYYDEWGASGRWYAIGQVLNDYLSEHTREISRSLVGRYYIHEPRDPKRIRVEYMDMGELGGEANA